MGPEYGPLIWDPYIHQSYTTSEKGPIHATPTKLGRSRYGAKLGAHTLSPSINYFDKAVAAGS